MRTLRHKYVVAVYSNTTVPPLAISLSVTQIGWTPLMQASQGGHVDVVNVLLKYGAKVNHETKVRRLQ